MELHTHQRIKAPRTWFPPSPQEELSWDPRHNDIGVLEPPGSGPSHLLEGPEGSPSPLEGEPRRLLELKN